MKNPTPRGMGFFIWPCRQVWYAPGTILEPFLGVSSMKKSFAFLSAAVLSLAGIAQAETPAAKKPAAPAAEQVDKITVTNKLVDGKKTWLPADIKLKAGEKVELSLVNTLAEPHGFNAPGMAQDVVVNANETKVVSFTAPKEAGTVKYTCHLHPAHVGGNIIVQ